MNGVCSRGDLEVFEVQQVLDFFKDSVERNEGDLFVGNLKDGYKLIEIANDGQACDNGGQSTWALLKDNKLQRVFHSCHCGYGCGGKDIVRDDWGCHNCEPELEAVRTD